MGYTGKQPAVTVLTSADIAPGTIEASDLNSTLNLSSMTVTLPASSVTAHVTSFDDQDIRSDILHLAIAQSLNDNRIAFSLEDSFIDTFEDSSGIDAGGNLTNVARDTSGEYVSSITGTPIDSNTLLLVQSNTTDGSTTFSDDSSYNRTVTGHADVKHKTTYAKVGTSSIYFDGADDRLSVPYDNAFNFPSMQDFTMEYYFYTTTLSNSHESFGNATSGQWTGLGYAFSVYSTGGLSFQGRIGGTQTTQHAQTTGLVTTGSWHHIAFVRTGGYIRGYVNGVESLSLSAGSDFSTQSGTFNFNRNYNFGDSNSYYDFIRVSDTARYTSNNFTPPTAIIYGQTANATGELISDPQTASSSRNSVSGVIIYSNAAGTNTLGTHLKIYFSCDNGSNWTESSSYGIPQTYSGTKKLVKLGATTCTAGNQILIKAVWAGQSASLEARLEGWAVNY